MGKKAATAVAISVILQTIEIEALPRIAQDLINN